jgi:diaminopimelate decarboxylase
VLARAGLGADVVSKGELDRALAAGVAAVDIVFSGVGKTAAELAHGLGKHIGQFNIESEGEGRELAAIAAAGGTTATATLRINPDVDAGTHAKISTGKAENKFGVAIHEAAAIYARLAALPGLNLRGIALHIGSMIADLAPLEAAFVKVGGLVAAIRDAGGVVTHVDLGGGLGVAYRPHDVLPWPDQYGAMVARVTHGWGVTLMFEPGRVIVGNAGVLLTRVIRVKPGAIHPFVVVDAAMNDLARPALYDAYHHFEPVAATAQTMTANIVGPVCESGDTFALAREIGAVAQGDLAIFRTAGAYGATMASTYNSRDLVPEVLVDGGRYAVVADRIPAQTIMASERVPDWLDD